MNNWFCLSLARKSIINPNYWTIKNVTTFVNVTYNLDIRKRVTFLDFKAVSYRKVCIGQEVDRSCDKVLLLLGTKLEKLASIKIALSIYHSQIWYPEILRYLRLDDGGDV